VSVTRESGRVAIQVRDHGAGIPPAEQKKVFERFYRGTTSASSRVKGTGIGLALVKNIVAAHDGEVRLESVHGVGSTFTILMPAVEDV
jgi:signal transduction histidine kinase